MHVSATTTPPPSPMPTRNPGLKPPRSRPASPLHAEWMTGNTGVPLRDLQEAASHADPRTTMRQCGPGAAWTGMPPTSSPPTSPARPGNEPQPPRRIPPRPGGLGSASHSLRPNRHARTAVMELIQPVDKGGLLGAEQADQREYLRVLGRRGRGPTTGLSYAAAVRDTIRRLMVDMVGGILVSLSPSSRPRGFECL
jgi:hypothetical protein